MLEVRIGPGDGTRVELAILGYALRQVAAAGGADAFACLVRVVAGPLRGEIECPIAARDLAAIRTYLEHIRSGNGPPASFEMAGGIFALSFAPSRRGPVLCAVSLKTVEASHARLQFMIALEPRDIGITLDGLQALPSAP